MQSDSAQLKFDLPLPEVGSATGGSAKVTNTQSNRSSTDSGQMVHEPNWGGSVLAAASRRAGRLNAANFSKAKHDALLKTHKALVTKQFGPGLSKQEESQLTYVGWQLDRIEDAKHGEQLDQLESMIERYEHFKNQLNRLTSEIAAISGNR